MTQDPAERPDQRGSDMPTVDEVIHDARELSGHSRADGQATDAVVATPTPVPATAGTSAGATSPHPAPATVAHGEARDDAHPAGHGSVAPGAHGDAHAGDAGHGTAHAPHDDPRDTHVGPIDTSMWLMGVLGVVIGLVVAACFVLAAGGIPGA